jgi:multidrug efflux pump subunit AcrA (membrane-fusion protein)
MSVWLKPAYLAPAAVTVALATTVAGCGSPDREAATASQASPVPVSVARAVSVDLPSHIEAGGIVQAGTTAQIMSRVVAPVQDVFVRAGDRVSRGQTLITLDSRELAAQGQRADAALKAATDAAQAAQSRTAAADAAQRLAKVTHTRISTLHERKSATQQELDQATAVLDGAAAQLQTAQSELAAATATREAARAAAEAAAVTRSYTVITAPFDGVVADRLIDPGSLASPGSPLLVVEQSGPLRLEVRLDQSRTAGITVGQPVEVRFDGQDAVTWTPARIAEVGRVDPVTHSFLIKIELPAGTSARTGSFGRARVAGPARRTLVVPSASLLRRAGLTFVFTCGRSSPATSNRTARRSWPALRLATRSSWRRRPP